MAGRAAARSLHSCVAALAELHLRGVQFVRGDVALADGPVTVVALDAIHQMKAVIEEDEVIELDHPHPRHSLLGCSMLGKFLNGGFVLGDQYMTRHAARRGREAHLRSELRGTGVTILA